MEIKTKRKSKTSDVTQPGTATSTPTTPKSTAAAPQSPQQERFRPFYFLIEVLINGIFPYSLILTGYAIFLTDDVDLFYRVALAGIFLLLPAITSILIGRWVRGLFSFVCVTLLSAVLTYLLWSSAPLIGVLFAAATVIQYAGQFRFIENHTERWTTECVISFSGLFFIEYLLAAWRGHEAIKPFLAIFLTFYLIAHILQRNRREMNTANDVGKSTKHFSAIRIRKINRQYMVALLLLCIVAYFGGQFLSRVMPLPSIKDFHITLPEYEPDDDPPEITQTPDDLPGDNPSDIPIIDAPGRPSPFMEWLDELLKNLFSARNFILFGSLILIGGSVYALVTIRIKRSQKDLTDIEKEHGESAFSLSTEAPHHRRERPFGLSPNAIIRRRFKKEVEKGTVPISAASTPKELLLKKNRSPLFSPKNAASPATLSSDEQTLLSLYTKARYSKDGCTRSDISTISKKS